MIRFFETIKTTKTSYHAVTQSPTQCFVEMSGFSDLARYACAFREYPLRVYSHNHKDNRIISAAMPLSNTLLIFYTQMTKTGRYISYNTVAGKEYCDIVDSTNDISVYAPIINFESEMSSLETSQDSVDRFNPVKISDIGSLARLTYDPEFPDERKLALFAFDHKKSWILGYPTSLDMNDIIYQFNYIELDSEPPKPFIKYQGNRGKDPEFTNTFEHGSSYLPIIKVKDHPIFGMS